MTSRRDLSRIKASDVQPELKPKKRPSLSKQLDRPSYVPLDFKLSTIRELLMIELEADDGYKAKAVASALINKAMEGDTYCLRLLLERVDGLMTKNISVNGSLAVGQVVTLVDTREFSAKLPIREGDTPAHAPTPTSPKLLDIGVEASASKPTVEVLGNVTPVSFDQSGEESQDS